jgi:hypothetical protein
VAWRLTDWSLPLSARQQATKPGGPRFGIRTRQTTRSSAAWDVAHRAVNGEVCLIGATSLLAALFDHIVGDEKPFGEVALLLALAFMIHAGFRADSAARKALPRETR